MTGEKKRIIISSVVEELDDSGLCESSESGESRAECFVSTCDGKTTFSYEENGEGGKVRSDIISDGTGLTVRRTGAVESEFVFREGERHRSVYTVKPYSFDAEVLTRKIRGALTPEGGEMTLFYEMTVGGAKKRTKMRIRVSEP